MHSTVASSVPSSVTFLKESSSALRHWRRRNYLCRSGGRKRKRLISNVEGYSRFLLDYFLRQHVLLCAVTSWIPK